MIILHRKNYGLVLLAMACVEACPVSINPLSIIMDMRQYLVMEQSAAPGDLNNMMSNIENNGAPWPFNQMDRLQWAEEN